MTTPTTQGATMTLPPCPIAGHDNPHHWHERKQEDEQIWHVDHRDGVPGIVCIAAGGLSRCYSAHVPESPEPAADEWVRVDVDTMIPEGVDFSKTSTNTWRVHKGHGPVYVRRSDLDKLTPPDPAAKLAGVLTGATGDDWTAADVLGLLKKSGGLTLAWGAEK